jgi:hypothetical protein
LNFYQFRFCKDPLFHHINIKNSLGFLYLIKYIIKDCNSE